MPDAETLTRAALTTDGRVLVQQPDGSYRAAQGQTDWARIDRTSEAELAATIAADSLRTTRPSGTNARLVHPRKERVTLRLDADVFDWFRRKGRGYQARINAILRRHCEHARSLSAARRRQRAKPKNK